uniref:NADH-ubiquinone oxidoreductase chain 4 n=1 Tax=Flustrellidra hispida TaxID=97271 RepID=Q15K51_9BILA|nr:NADH dehydrogenase subunit 4 [Flustrellidra hispida]AAZ76750.1 NADH dehydrogenase subunit 4 [Flustrellidra hispida]
MLVLCVSPLVVLLALLQASPVALGFNLSLNTNNALLCEMTLILLVIMILCYWSSPLFAFFSVSVCALCAFFFLADNYLVMYASLEGSLIPTVLIINMWGYQPEKITSMLYLLMYTITLSLPLLLVLLSLFTSYTSFSMLWFYLSPAFSPVLWVAVLAFLVKTPIWSVHFWLPRAHVQAPLAGSVILAGALLKLGGWGIYCIVNVYGPHNMYTFFFALALGGGALVVTLCLRSTDIKSLIAYSSVIHMATMLAGLFTYSLTGWSGALCMMVAHGLTSPAMFILANSNYEINSSRNLLHMKGLATSQPVLMLMWFLTMCSNMSVPPVLSFMSEIMLYASIMSSGTFFGAVAVFLVLGGGAYNLYYYSSFGGSTPLSPTSVKPRWMLMIQTLSLPALTWSLFYLF